MERGFLIRSSYALISIRDSDAARARVPKVAGLRGVLHLAFDDAEPAESFQLPPDIKLMTDHHARRIWRFVRFHREQVGAFVVHCHQGMSRSPAVAAAIAAHLRVDGREFMEDYTPNQYVYRLLLKTMPAFNGANSLGGGYR